MSVPLSRGHRAHSTDTAPSCTRVSWAPPRALEPRCQGLGLWGEADDRQRHPEYPLSLPQMWAPLLLAEVQRVSKRPAPESAWAQVSWQLGGNRPHPRSSNQLPLTRTNAGKQDAHPEECPKPEAQTASGFKQEE